MYNFKLTEEISRWAFEIVCKENPNWYIAFTNPTAGPWKTIKCFDKNGIEGEVYRFELEKTRPDILLINDSLKLIIVIEAKDSITKLTNGDQCAKSVEVVHSLSKILTSAEAKNNPYWNNRAHYTMLTGLLWGAEETTNSTTLNNTFDQYHSEMKNFPHLTNHLILGIETRRNGDNLKCYLCGKSYGSHKNNIQFSIIAESFGLPILQSI